MANFYYPSQPPVVGNDGAGAAGLGSLFNSGSSFPTQFIDFLQITALQVDYSKGAALSNAGAAGASAVKDNVSTGDSIFLYMPQNLTASYVSNYSNMAFGIAGKMAAEMLGKSGTNVVAEIQAAAGASAPEALFNNIAKGANQLAGAVGTGGSVDGTALSAVSQGKIFNPFEEQIFTGISFRTHPFQWKLVARNKTEAINIYNIIRFLKINMLPNFTGSSFSPATGAGSLASSATAANPTGNNAAVVGATPFGSGSQGRYLSVPNRFRLAMKRVNYSGGSFTSGGELEGVYKFKDCILESLNVSYTPDGSYVTTSDGMVPAYQLDATFKEVAYVTSNDAANGY